MYILTFCCMLIWFFVKHWSIYIKVDGWSCWNNPPQVLGIKGSVFLVFIVERKYSNTTRGFSHTLQTYSLVLLHTHFLCIYCNTGKLSCIEALRTYFCFEMLKELLFPHCCQDQMYSHYIYFCDVWILNVKIDYITNQKKSHIS